MDKMKQNENFFMLLKMWCHEVLLSQYIFINSTIT